MNKIFRIVLLFSEHFSESINLESSMVRIRGDNTLINSTEGGRGEEEWDTFEKASREALGKT